MTTKVWKTSTPYFFISLGLYAIFDIFNATITCNSTRLELVTGATSFLGFWFLLVAAVLTFTEWQRERKFSWQIVAIPILIIVLTLADFLFGKSCSI